LRDYALASLFSILRGRQLKSWGRQLATSKIFSKILIIVLASEFFENAVL
jgi:hypothetical protein